mgnify:FL=1
MSNNINDLFANLNVPDDVKQMINSSSSNDLNNLLSQVSPEMINNLSNILNSNTQTSSQNSSNQNINNSTPNNNNNLNLDMNTIMKMMSIMENMNNKNDPRANLLYSLKPYLRDSKKDKLDQYVNLLNVSKIAELMNKNNDNKKE